MSIADSSYVKGDGELGREESATASRFVMSSLFGKPNDDVIFFLVVVYKKEKENQKMRMTLYLTHAVV